MLENALRRVFFFSVFRYNTGIMTLGRGLESLIPKGGYQGGGTPPNAPQGKPGAEPAKPANPPAPRFQAPASIHTASLPARQEPPRVVAEVRREEPGRELHQETRPQNERMPKDRPEREAVFHIEVEKIHPNPYQPRHEFNPEELEELAQSIREYGIIQPLIVSKIVRETETGADVEYQLIAGERRLLAAKKIGLMRVPAIVRRADTPKMKLELALIENIQRSDLSPLETAKAYAKLQDEFGLAQREIAMRVGKSREVVANTLRLLNLPSEIQDALSRGEINESQALILLSATDAAEQMRLFRDLLRQKMSVRELRRKTQTGTVAVSPLQNSEHRFWEEQLEEKLGAPVKVIGEKDRGRVVIEFFSEEERAELLHRLLGERAGE